MAPTRIADVIEPRIFLPYVIQRTTKKSLLFQSGLISTDQKISAAAKSGGRTVNMPYWNELSGASEVLSDTVPLTPDKITTGQDIATMIMRGKAWAANDLATQVAGDDPMKAIASQVGDYWAAEMQTVANSILTGLFKAAGPLVTTHTNDISIQDGNAATDANKFSAEGLQDALFKLGDRESELTALMVHSVIYKRMKNLDLIEFQKDSQGGAPIPTYLGRRVIVDDDSLKIAGTTSGYRYYSFAFGPGCFGWGEGLVDNPVETDRDSLAGDDILIHRRHYILHPRGVKWVGTPAGTSPTDVELATAANWTKVWNDKNIRVVAFVTNG